MEVHFWYDYLDKFCDLGTQMWLSLFRQLTGLIGCRFSDIMPVRAVGSLPPITYCAHSLYPLPGYLFPRAMKFFCADTSTQEIPMRGTQRMALDPSLKLKEQQPK
jgi:hypothetical protein